MTEIEDSILSEHGTEHELRVGDIIQIAPGHKWAFCLATVDEVKSWGVQAFVRIPTNDGTPGGDAYIRLTNADFHPVGAQAVWMPE